MTDKNAGFTSLEEIYGTMLVLKSLISQLVAARPDGQDLMGRFASFSTRLKADALAAEEDGDSDKSKLISEIANGTEKAVTEITHMVADIQRRLKKD